MNSRRYIVVTPCRNEEKKLPNLVQSITAQTIRPALWVIVDDGSTDKTGEIISECGIWNVEAPAPCFIATAAYGTPLHEDIDALLPSETNIW